MSKTPLFLERKRYRMRRIVDAIRILPVVCAVLWIVIPLMWNTAQEGQAATSLSTALWYIFGIWSLAVAASFALWRRSKAGDEGTDTRADDASR
ncbi:hypothetical protein [uncultured Sulfitobacter sp.]|uniref:hypothetical protein n=1 Tax=uncultured Sulfitobacter sp. TaxID=191468 RepID=UPI0026087636|nr:hypothetical protein [uncultured Sulfitobacter sp.]